MGSAENYMSRTARKRLLLLALAVILGFSVVCALAVGRYQISFRDVLGILFSRFSDAEPGWDRQSESVLMTIRLPRVLGALIAGCALALSGAAYQSVFKNPLVSPDLLGVSSGACVGASVAILWHMGSFEIQLMALLCGLAAVGLTCLVPRLLKNRSNLTLVLAGVIISGIMNALQGFVKYTADPDEELPSIVYWTMGSLASVRISDILMIIVPVAACTAVMLLLRWKLNLLTLGEQEAASLGVRVRLLTGVSILCSTVLTACAVCISGTIGWIGLVVPHIARLLMGQDNRYILPASALIGSVFLIWMDTLARNLVSSEIPLSILTGLCGGPLFLLILTKRGLK